MRKPVSKPVSAVSSVRQPSVDAFVDETQKAQALAQELGLSPDAALFFQEMPGELLARLASGEINLVRMAQQALKSRGLNAQGGEADLQGVAGKGSSPSAVDLHTFACEEHDRVEAFRVRWLQANAINEEMFPLAIRSDNAGMWTEALMIFDAEDPFPMPSPPDVKPVSTNDPDEDTERRKRRRRPG